MRVLAAGVMAGHAGRAGRSGRPRTGLRDRRGRGCRKAAPSELIFRISKVVATLSTTGSLYLGDVVFTESQSGNRRRTEPPNDSSLRASVCIGGDDDLSVDDATLRKLRGGGCHELGEVSGERAFIAAAEFDLVAVAKADRPEAVPRRFVRRAGRDRRNRLGQHRRDRRHVGQVHQSIEQAMTLSGYPGLREYENHGPPRAAADRADARQGHAKVPDDAGMWSYEPKWDGFLH